MDRKFFFAWFQDKTYEIWKIAFKVLKSLGVSPMHTCTLCVPHPYAWSPWREGLPESVVLCSMMFSQILLNCVSITSCSTDFDLLFFYCVFVTIGYNHTKVWPKLPRFFKKMLAEELQNPLIRKKIQETRIARFIRGKSNTNLNNDKATPRAPRDIHDASKEDHSTHTSEQPSSLRYQGCTPKAVAST
jgi:hypothetical protein